MIARQLHDERSRVAGEDLELLEHDARDDDGQHAQNISRECDGAGAAKERACEHCDDRQLSAARYEAGGHDGHAAVALLLNGTGSHDSRYAAAGADQHRDEGLARKTELAEDTVHDECNTRHVAAVLEDREEEEQDEHLRNEAQHRADTGNDTVHYQAVNPAVLVNAHGSEQLLQQHRDTRNPNTEVSRVRLRSGQGVCKACEVNVLGGNLTGVLVLERGSADNRCGSRVCLDGSSCVSDSGLVRLFSVQLLGQSRGVDAGLVGSLEPCVAAGDLVVILGGCFLIVGSADGEQMPAVTEHTVVCPVGEDAACGGYGNVVDQPHDQCEDRQSEDSVGNDVVDLIRGGQTGLFLLYAVLDQLSDVLIACIGDDGLRIVVELLLNGGDELLDLVLHVLAEGKARLHLAVALEQLDSEPAALRRLGNIRDELLDLGDGVLDGAAEAVHCRSLRSLCRLLGSLDQLPGALALDGCGLNDRHAELLRQLLYVDHVAALLDDIHHVQRDNDRNAHLEQLGGQVQVALDVGSIDEVHDGLRLLIYEVITRNDLLQRVRREGVDTRQVGDQDFLIALELAFLLFHGNARPVADILGRTGQIVKHRGLAAVRVAGKCQTN